MAQAVSQGTDSAMQQENNIYNIFHGLLQHAHQIAAELEDVTKK
jgi:hypothetical protein